MLLLQLSLRLLCSLANRCRDAMRRCFSPWCVVWVVRVDARVYDEHLAPTLSNAFQARYKEILDVSQSANAGDVMKFTAGLTVRERQCTQLRAAAAGPNAVTHHASLWG